MVAFVCSGVLEIPGFESVGTIGGPQANHNLCAPDSKLCLEPVLSILCLIRFYSTCHSNMCAQNCDAAPALGLLPLKLGRPGSLSTDCHSRKGLQAVAKAPAKLAPPTPRGLSVSKPPPRSCAARRLWQVLELQPAAKTELLMKAARDVTLEKTVLK